MKFKRNLILLVLLGLGMIYGCAPKTNDGLSPTQPSYTGSPVWGIPLVLYNGELAPGISPTVFLPNYCGPTYTYDPEDLITFSDTTVKPTQGEANMVFGVKSYSASGNTCANFAVMALTPSAAPTLDLSSVGYTSLSFWAQANKPVFVNFNGGTSATVPELLNTTWQHFTIPMGGSLNAVGVLFAIGISSPAPLPVTVFVNELTYQ